MSAFGSNLPPGVTEAHPHFNPPEEVSCPSPDGDLDCGEDVYPGETCHGCGREMETEEEMRRDAEEAAAEARFDMEHDEGWR